MKRRSTCIKRGATIGRSNKCCVCRKSFNPDLSRYVRVMYERRHDDTKPFQEDFHLACFRALISDNPEVRRSRIISVEPDRWAIVKRGARDWRQMIGSSDL